MKTSEVFEFVMNWFVSSFLYEQKIWFMNFQKKFKNETNEEIIEKIKILEKQGVLREVKFCYKTSKFYKYRAWLIFDCDKPFENFYESFCKNNFKEDEKDGHE